MFKLTSCYSVKIILLFNSSVLSTNSYLDNGITSVIHYNLCISINVEQSNISFAFSIAKV